MNDQKPKTVFEERDALKRQVDFLKKALDLFSAKCEQLRRVADAAAEWADAFLGYEAGASGSGEYLRAREQLLRATVREYRAHLEAQAVMSRPGAQRGMEQLEGMD